MTMRDETVVGLLPFFELPAASQSPSCCVQLWEAPITSMTEPAREQKHLETTQCDCDCACDC